MKLTPPAPQHMMRRFQFFIDHPDYPGSSDHLAQSRRDIDWANRYHYFRAPEVKSLSFFDVVNNWIKTFISTKKTFGLKNGRSGSSTYRSKMKDYKRVN